MHLYCNFWCYGTLQSIWVELQPLLPNGIPHLLVVYPVPKNKPMTTKSQWFNYFIRNGGNATPGACPEAKSSNPTTGLALLWAHNPGRGNSNYWQVSQKAEHIIPKRLLTNEKGTKIQICNLECYRAKKNGRIITQSLKENNIKISVITEVKRNCKVLKRLKIILLFTRELTDTPEARQE